MFGYEVSTLIVHSIKSYVRPLSLAWCELYLVFGNLFRKLDMEIYKTRSAIFSVISYFSSPKLLYSPEDLSFWCHFLPIFCGRHLHATARDCR